MDVADLVPAARKLSVRRWLRPSTLHFLLLGGLLFAGQQLIVHPPAAPADTRPIRVSLTQIDQLRAQWRRESGREPDAGELRAGISHLVDEEVLLREALRLDLDRRDPVARRRLLRNMRFAFPGRRIADEALFAEARRLGMNHRDPVVRRRLIQVMERRLSAEIPYDAATLRAYIAQHPERYGTPAHFAFTQVFVDASRSDGRADAERLRQQLETGDADPHTLGDRFLLGASIADSDVRSLTARYGDAFAQAVASARPGEWIGPLQTAYGWHLVRVDRREPARPPDFAAISRQAADAWLDEQRARILHETLSAMRGRYRIEIAGNDHAGGPA